MHDDGKPVTPGERSSDAIVANIEGRPARHDEMVRSWLRGGFASAPSSHALANPAAPTDRPDKNPAPPPQGCACFAD